MELSIQERLFIPFILPTTGGRIEMATVLDILDKINLSEDEKKNINLKSAPDAQGVKLTWDPEKLEKITKKTEIKFNDNEINFIKSIFDEMDKKKTLTLNLAKLCQKF